MDKTRLEIRLNGVLGPFQREPGCPCPRCTDPDPQQRANTSASIILRRGDSLLEHHLVDVGLGVVESLDAPEMQGPWPIDSLILTHAHFDHIAGIDWLANSLSRARESGAIPDQRSPLPIYCTQGTWESGPASHFPYLTPSKMVHRPISVGKGFSPGQFTGLTLIPLPVVHFKDSVIFVLQFWRDPGRKTGHPPDRKVILCWDLLRFTRQGDTRATSYHDYVEGLDEQSPLLLNADLLLIAAYTWHPRPETGHISFTEDQRLIEFWKSKATRIVHYSGWEDRPAKNSPIDPMNTDPRRGPVSSATLRAEVQKVLGESVGVGYAGERFVYV